MKKTILFMAVVTALGLSAWTFTAPAPEMVTVDLTSKGIPVKIQAPSGYEIKEGIYADEYEGIITYSWDIVKDMYNLSVYMDDDEPWQDKADYFSDAKDYASSEDGFEGYMVEDADGFIYKTNDPDIGVDYGFYYVKEKNGRIIEFEHGFSFENFTLEDAKVMYNAAKNAE